jgi:hypothetical protein
MTSKNPYEIRLDVLKMAQEMLETEQRAKELAFKEKIETLRSTKGDGQHLLDFVDKNAPTGYKPEDVLNRSYALYEFVSSTIINKK